MIDIAQAWFNIAGAPLNLWAQVAILVMFGACFGALAGWICISLALPFLLPQPVVADEHQHARGDIPAMPRARSLSAGGSDTKTASGIHSADSFSSVFIEGQ